MSTFVQVVMKQPWETQGKDKMTTPALLTTSEAHCLFLYPPMLKPSMPLSLRSTCCTRKHKQEEAQEATREEGPILSFTLWALKRKLRNPFLYSCSPIQELGPSPSDGEGQEKKKKKAS